MSLSSAARLAVRYALLPLALVALVPGCNDDPPGGGGAEGGRTISVPFDTEFGALTLIQALEMALPGDSILVQSGHSETFAQVVIIQSSQTPFYLGGGKTRPVVTAPVGGTAAIVFRNPKEGTLVELMDFRGGNAALQAMGGFLNVAGCAFRGGQVHVRGSDGATLRVKECLMDSPGVFGIELSAGGATATQNTIYRAGDCGMLIVGGAVLVADKNLIVEAANWGIACQAGGTLGAGSLCNDILASGTADYSPGCAIPETDFSIDPMFCDTGARDFRLDSRSVCAPQNVEGSECAVSGNPELGVGAMAVGCSPDDL